MLKGKGRLLVVEDHPGTARSLKQFFERHIRVEHAATAAEAIAIIESGVELRGAIIDIMLPDGTGIDVLAVVRRRYPRIQVMMLTGHCQPGYVNSAQHLGAQYAIKPASIKTLYAYLRSLEADVPAPVNGGPIVKATIDRVVADMTLKFKLVPSEARVLSVLGHAKARGDVAEELGITENTVKSAVATLLEKTGQESAVALQREVWRRAEGL